MRLYTSISSCINENIIMFIKHNKDIHLKKSKKVFRHVGQQVYPLHIILAKLLQDK